MISPTKINLEKSNKDGLDNSYIKYYVFNLVCSAAIISFYSVFAFTQGPECKTETGLDV